MAPNHHETPTDRGRSDDDRRGQRDSRQPDLMGAVSALVSASVGRAAGAPLTGPCRSGKSQAPVREQHPDGSHGAIGSFSAPVGQSENLNILPGGFFARLSGGAFPVHLEPDSTHLDGTPRGMGE